MRIMNEIQWTGEYTMEDFVTEFSKRTPVLMRTLTGTLGCDELHIISGDEIYWIRSLKKQKRIVVATKDKDKFLSIPVTYNRLSFEVYSEESIPIASDQLFEQKIQPGKPLTAIMEEVELESGKRYFIRAEQNKKMFFQVGSDAGNNARFGVMEIIDTYEEKYLLGHPICNNQIHSNTFAIPVYMNIELTVATSFLTHCQESFDTWFKHVEAIVSKFHEGEVKMCEEIILFDKCPNNNTYEYIDPRTFTLNEKSKNSLQDYTRESNPYVIDKPTLPDRTTSLWKQTTVQSVTLPHIPRRTPPAPPQEGQESAPGEPPTNSKISSKRVHKGSVKVHKAPPAPPKPPGDYERPCPHPQDNQPYVSVIQRNLNADLKKNFEELKKCRNSTFLKPDSGDIVRKAAITESVPQDGDRSGTSSIYEVSPNADVKRFSIRDVQRSLKLLNLEKHCELFEEMQVDGELLLEMMMREEILTEDFHLTKFEAMKLIKFAKHGWRPNM